MEAQQLSLTTIHPSIPDLIIPPGGHAEICCAILRGASDSEPSGGGDVRNELLNSLETFMIRPTVIEFFETLPIEERKRFEGLEGFALAAAIEERYELSVLEKLYATLPPAAKKKFDKLPHEERYDELRRLKAASEQKAYDSERQMAANTAAYVKNNMVPEQQSLFAPYPHDLARRSVFFIEENEGQKRDHLAEFVIGAGPWGVIVYSGNTLFTADEKAWVVLLGLAAVQKKRGVVDWHVVRGSIRSFLREAGLSESGQYSERFVESIQAMHGGTFRFEGKEFRQEGKTKKKPLKERIEGYHLLSNYTVDNTTGEFVVILDRSYIETFITEFHMYARLDIKRFCKQKPTASALHRFFAGHTPGPDGCIYMNLFLVAKSTNMMREYPHDITEWPNPDVKYEKKRLINRALTRLVQDGTFSSRTGVKVRGRGEDDLVVIDFHTAEKLARSTAGKKRQLPQKVTATV
jgi:hypothetical protein